MLATLDIQRAPKDLNVEDPPVSPNRLRVPTPCISQRLTVAQIITQLDLGGAQQHVLTLLRHLDQSRYRLLLVTGSSGLLTSEASVLPGIERFEVSSLRREVHPWYDAKALGVLARLLARHQVDIVHTHSSKAGVVGRLAAQLAGVPMVVHTVHGFGVDVGRGPLRPLLRWSERMAALMTDRLIAVSERTRAEGVRMGVGRPEQYETIPYRIDEEPFVSCASHRETARAGMGLNGAPTVGMVACLKPQKAPADFLCLARLVSERVPSAQFLLIGDGPMRDRLERRIRQLGLSGRCRLLGWHRDIPELLSAIDVLVLCSRWEGLPIAILEAMAAAKPVVAMDVGGVCEAVSDGETGYIVPPGDLRLMADRVVSLLESPEQQAEMGRQGYERFRARFHGAARMVDRLDALYQEAWRAR